MRVFRLAAIVCLAAFLWGCGSSSSGPSPAPEYFPLTVGNVWNHEVTSQWFSPTDTLDATGTMTRLITGTATHENGRTLFAMQSISEFEVPFGDTTIVWADTSISYGFDADSEFIAYDDTVSAEYEIFMKLPPTVGETWEPMSDDSTIVREVISITASVSVPAGNFSDCIHIRDTDTDEPEYSWDTYIADGVGPVLYEVFEEDSVFTMDTDIELTSYVVN